MFLIELERVLLKHRFCYVYGFLFINKLERHYKYKRSKDELHMIDAYIDVCDPIFHVLPKLTQIATHTHYEERINPAYQVSSHMEAG
jgi:hypothetical protein